MQELESQFTAKFIHIITKGKKVNTYKFALAKSILEFVEVNRSQKLLPTLTKYGG